ncbi:MAG: hypothetical protein R3194_13105 [Limnobacter sp.]|nr:hypothetical protein [Limnobacter sp.]
MPWVADGFNLIFGLMAVVWSVFMVFDPITYNAPPMLISLIPIVFFTFKMIKMLALYLGEVRSGLGSALAASIGGLSLSYAIGRAVLSGLFVGKKKPFLRTPKKRPKAAFLQALQDAREECLIALVLTSAIVAVALQVGFDSDETFYWALVLGVQSVPYWAAVLVSLISVLPGRRQTPASHTQSFSD